MTKPFDHRKILPFACLVWGLFLPVLSPTPVRADTSRELQHAVHRLEIWLATSDDADGWRRYLNLNSLESQAARGTQADVAQLVDILKRFSTDAKGLDARPFNDVRVALQAQIQQLTQAASGDLPAELRKAREDYRQISIAQLEQRRDKAVYDLQQLKQFYKSHLYSRERAEVFYDLKPDELIEFLEDLQFELPPDVSVGKLNDRLSAIRKKLDDLETQRDQLPEAEGPSINPPQSDNLDEPKANLPSSQPTPADEPRQNNTDSTVESQGTAVGEKQQSPAEARRQREALDEEIEKLSRQFDQLTQDRNRVRELDSDRQRQRARDWRELAIFTRGFVEVAKRRSDYFFESSYHSYSKFALLFFYGTDDNLEADYNRILDTLEQELPKLDYANDRDALVLITDAAGWLEATDLAPGLLAAIQKRYSSPNFKISVSSNFVNRLAAQTIHQTLPVNEQMFGRLIRGVAQSDSQVTIDFIDDPYQARFSLRLTGTVDTQSHTQSGPFTAYAGGHGSFEGRQNIALNVGGLIVGVPYVAATLSSDFYGISSQLEFVQNAARKMYLKDRVRTERESARRLKARVSDEFTDQVNDAVSQAIDRFKAALEKTVDFGDYIPELHVYTTNERLIAVGHKSLFELSDAGRVSNLASPFADQAPSVNADVTIQLHESLLGNYLDPWFVNRTFTNDQLAQRIEELTGEKTEGLATDAEAGDEPWSITFANVRPVQLEFENNAFAVVITGRRFTQGDSQIQAGLKFRVPFKILRQEGHLKLLRDGDATIDYVDPDKKTAKLVAFRSLLETKLNSAARKQEDEPSEKPSLREGFVLPENLIPADQLEQLKNNAKIAQAMRLVEFRMTNGWLSASWNYVPESDIATWPSDTPAIWNEISRAREREVELPTDVETIPNRSVSE